MFVPKVKTLGLSVRRSRLAGDNQMSVPVTELNLKERSENRRKAAMKAKKGLFDLPLLITCAVVLLVFNGWLISQGMLNPSSAIFALGVVVGVYYFIVFLRAT